MSASRRRAWGGELRAQFRLALPVVVIQVGVMAMGVVDSMFMGRVSATHFAATTLGNTWSFLWIALGFGILTGLDPITSQAFGARDHAAIARGLQRGLFLSLAMTLPIAVPIAFAESAFSAFGQPREVVPLASSYALVSIAGVTPFLGFVALRSVLQSMHRLRPLVFVILLANVLNALLDWILIFGNWGAAPMGAVGSSWATVVSRWFMFLFLPVLAWPLLSSYLRPWRGDALRLRPILRMVNIGWPVGLQFMIEIGAFGVVTFLMGGFGADEIAGHQVALTLASLSFMVPLGISIATSVRVGNEIGRGDPLAARLAAAVGLLCGALVMSIFACLFFTMPESLSRLFTDQPGVLPVAISLLPLAAFFQVFDGIQVVAVGALRGAADTRIPLFTHVVGFWLIGVPAGWYLAFRRDMGPEGLWWGLVAGLGAVALFLLLRLRVRLSRSLERVRIEEDDLRESV